ncbi:putative cytochrome b5-like heme/steroid binding domain-containing protein [Helianthus annuus]|uniref:Cytochrome b5-like heme/steroid binding domain-containing protein n=1 Tax=Helianthus annuus TaxID=4232 RepID=A0A251SUZ2_HELAN|nr:putative cytochrome b5-like heme/steroid binding domain-containing protein [Helianthus annuus]KAJ0610206.1 putative cytochrome b5-like heme/steroid binding domain-containing protein [Helianthus annuus]KAJ0620820.1 putative cytochrome b5-like heme/steroid binding domain-containing protein [Helianthus annuus]KAJ0625411.1 putative cytochrome b5-like heme/steroid binding domain-containing protein [Helianthus annuus]KAJ0781831.1 putative cytochrome b5-like heme/steroid binding domain-containing p
MVSKAYNKAEVYLHNKRTNCWIIIKDKVYDVTPYVEEHLGGDAILAHAGDDSTEGFFG